MTRKRKDKWVEYYVDGSASYTVTIFQEDNVIEEYTAGNSLFDSQIYLGDDKGVSRKILTEWAKQTANEMAEEHELTVKDIFKREK